MIINTNISGLNGSPYIDGSVDYESNPVEFSWTNSYQTQVRVDFIGVSFVTSADWQGNISGFGTGGIIEKPVGNLYTLSLAAIHDPVNNPQIEVIMGFFSNETLLNKATVVKAFPTYLGIMLELKGSSLILNPGDKISIGANSGLIDVNLPQIVRMSAGFAGEVLGGGQIP